MFDGQYRAMLACPAVYTMKALWPSIAHDFFEFHFMSVLGEI